MTTFMLGLYLSYACFDKITIVWDTYNDATGAVNWCY